MCGQYHDLMVLCNQRSVEEWGNTSTVWALNDTHCGPVYQQKICRIDVRLNKNKSTVTHEENLNFYKH